VDTKPTMMMMMMKQKSRVTNRTRSSAVAEKTRDAAYMTASCAVKKELIESGLRGQDRTKEDRLATVFTTFNSVTDLIDVDAIAELQPKIKWSRC